MTEEAKQEVKKQDGMQEALQQASVEVAVTMPVGVWNRIYEVLSAADPLGVAYAGERNLILQALNQAKGSKAE